VMAKAGPLSTDDRERRRQIYDIEITYMDGQIGRVFDKLRELGQWDDCVIVATSDHGEGLGDHDWWTHGVLYQEQVRVPLIIRAPSMPPGRTVDSVVRSIDIAPTVTELAGLSSEEVPVFDGSSLAPLLRNDASDLQLSAYSDSVNTLTYTVSADIRDKKDDLLFALVIEGRWKFILHLRKREESELFDLQTDPHELKNLAAERPEIVERARAELMKLDFMPYNQLKSEKTPPHVLEQLKKLGYTGDVTEGE